MSMPAGGLHELHQLHLQLERVREALARGPRQITAKQRVIERKESDVQELRGKVRQLKISADEKSLQLKTNEAKILDLKGKLNAAASNREFEIIKSQIDADTMANSVLEDEILEVFEQLDQLESQIAETEEQREAAVAAAKKVREQVEAETPGLRGEADRLEQALSSIERTLPESVRVVYHRLVAAHGAGALASLDGISCGACYANLSPNVRVEINLGKFTFCSSCGRLLYKPEA
ncbi:MAG: zinc ribbon domain-containing protein [Planctomycetaceae bacterium]